MNGNCIRRVAGWNVIAALFLALAYCGGGGGGGSDTDVRARIEKGLQKAGINQEGQRNVRVRVFNGWVTLEGTVANNAQKEKASKIAANQSSRMQGFTNNLNVAGGVGSASNDAIANLLEAISSEAKVEYATDGSGNVSLTGTVPSEEVRQKLTETVSALPGVRNVDTQLTIVPKRAVKELTIKSGKLQSVYFDSNRDVVRPESLKSVLLAAQALKEMPETYVRLEGHADGTEPDPRALAENRANAVREALIEEGVRADRLHVVEFGADRPVSSNETHEGRADNRRVELRLTEQSE